MVLMGRLAVESVRYKEKKKYKVPLSKDVFEKQRTLKQELKKEKKFFEDEDVDDDDEIQKAVKKKRKKYI